MMRRTPMKRTPFKRASTTTHESEQEREQRLIDKARRAMNSVVPRAANMGSATTAAAPIPKAASMAAKVERASIRARKEAIKPRAKWLAECQAIVNKIVRLRDRHLPCCSCDRPASWDGQWHASHLRSVGAASAVRFNLWNIHKGCSVCNNHLSGNLAEYLPRIRARIGDDKVDWLYRQNQIASYDIDYLKRFKAVMSKKLRRMENRHAK